MAESITFDVLARDRASATFNKIGQSTASLETRFTRLTRAATGIATTLVGAQVGKSVLEAADQFELSRSRLETITRNIGGNFDGLSKQVDAADQRMAAFGYTSAETEGALASLESVTRDPTKALQDLGLAADIARGRNIGLSEATLILQRVETGHVAQLAKLGIATKDANGHLLTQAQALQMLTDLYGGAASNYAGTFAGKQAAVAAELKNSAAQIGVALLPAAVDLANAIQHDLLPPLVSAAHWFDQNKRTIEPLAKAVLIAVAAWKAYSIWVRASAAANVLFSRSTAAAAAGAATTAGAAGAAGAAGGATTGAAAATTEGTAIGTGMATRLNTGLVGLASNAAMAAKNVGMMGLATLGFVNFIKNPKSLGFPMGFNNDLGVGRDKVVGGKPSAFIGPDGRQYSDPGLKHLIIDTKAATAATQAATSAERIYGAVVARTATQIASHAQKTINFKQAQDGVRQAMHDAAQTAADSGRALKGNSDAALANRGALMNQVTAVLNVIDVMKANGSSAANQKTMLDILTRAVENNAIKIYGDKAAVDAFLASLGLVPDAVNNVATAMASLPSATQQNLNSDRVSPGAIHQLNQGVEKAKATANKQGKDVAKSFTDGYSPVVAKVPKAASDAAKKAADAFNTLKGQMKSDLQSISDAVKSTQSSVAGFADFSVTGTDALGASGLNTDVTGQLKAKAGKLEQFARLFNQLDRAGLDAHLMAQFAQTGLDAIPAMQALLHSGRRGIGQVNRIEQRIQTAAGSVATTSAREDNSGLIHKDLTTLPAKLGREFAKGLKNVHVSVSLRETDRKNGIAVVTSP